MMRVVFPTAEIASFDVNKRTKDGPRMKDKAVIPMKPDRPVPLAENSGPLRVGPPVSIAPVRVRGRRLTHRLGPESNELSKLPFPTIRRLSSANDAILRRHCPLASLS